LAVAVVLLPARAMNARAAPADCALAADTGSIDALTSLTIPFNCATTGTVFFAACDSGGVANDDLGLGYQASVGGGLTYGLTPDIQLDASMYFGISEEADDFSAGVGLSFRI